MITKWCINLLVVSTVMLGHRSLAAPILKEPNTLPREAPQLIRSTQVEPIEQESQSQTEEAERLQRRDLFLATSRNGPREQLLNVLSHVSGEELDLGLEGTGLAGLGASFVDAEEAYQVNAVILVSIAALESGWGQSEYAQERNNLFGYTAYTQDPNQAMHFSSQEEAIMVAARTIDRDYLTESGRYYRGGTIRAVGSIWAHDPNWASKVASIAGALTKRIQKGVYE